MIGETGERKSAVATPDGKSRKKKNCHFSNCYINLPIYLKINDYNIDYLLMLRNNFTLLFYKVALMLATCLNVSLID